MSINLLYVSQFSLPKAIEFFLGSFEPSCQTQFRSTPSCLFSLKLMFGCSKSESLHDVSINRIGDTLSYGFPKTELESFALISRIDPHILPKVSCVYWQLDHCKILMLLMWQEVLLKGGQFDNKDGAYYICQ